MNKNKTKNLLIEIGVEELPIAALAPIAQKFEALIRNKLIEKEFLAQTESKISESLLVSPRRFACRINQVLSESQEKIMIKRGPKEGINPVILEKFASSCGLRVTELILETTAKGNYYFAKIKQTPKQLNNEIATIISQSLTAISTKKSMRWANFDYSFLRPIHWIVAKYGKNTLSGEVWGLKIANQTEAHRFQQSTNVLIDDEKNYESILEKNKVLVSVQQREQSIVKQILEKFPECKNQLDKVETYAKLVANLVQWPVVLVGKIAEKYLKELPVEVLETILLKHQFCYIPYKPVKNNSSDAKNQSMKPAYQVLSPNFITVSNLESKNPKLVIKGYQKVITARLEDGLFFYKNDAKIGKFKAQCQNLASLIFHNKLGSYQQKIKRMGDIAQFITTEKITLKKLNTAIQYSKNDLLSQSVIEMPSLQGIFGAYLAKSITSDTEIIFAIKQQYLPISRYDNLPNNQIGQLLSLVDKLDSLIGLWLADLAPKGSKDPFALRRTALAIVRLLNEGNIKIVQTLENLLAQVVKIYKQQILSLSFNQQSVVKEINQFIKERMQVYFAEKYNTLPNDLIRSVLNKQKQLPHLIEENLKEIEEFFKTELIPLKNILSSYKRIQNLVKNSNYDPTLQLDKKLLNKNEEIALLTKLNRHQRKNSLTSELLSLALFHHAIAEFLEKIQINTEDKRLKNQRQLLLHKIKAIFDDVRIDLSSIQTID